LRRAHFVGSTTALLHYATRSKAREIIVGTEAGILHQMMKAAPEKVLIPLPPDANCACNECPHMKRNSLEKVYLALRDLEPRLEMSKDLIERARIPIERMLALST
jgi:quinolinate synthase